MRVLSLFDGMACGMLAFTEAGCEIERYVAYEYDETSANAEKGRPFGYAALTASHNFPMIEQRGDVFRADFTEFLGFDAVIGGSPCTYWSIAQTNNRETTASGIGWELFCQFVRAVKEVMPKFFIYENNRSMSKAIRASIDEAFGFEATEINSNLVSAQNRQRLYWVGRRNDDGTYSKVSVEQPEDLGVLLQDVLCNGMCWRDKSYTIDSNYHKTLGQQGFDRQSGRRKMVAEPVAFAIREKANCLCGNRGGTSFKHDLEKSKHNYAAEPVCAKPLSEKEMEYMVRETKDGRNHFDFDHWHNATQEKSACITANMHKGVPYNVVAVPVEFDGETPIKAISAADGKEYPVYEVKNGQLTIKGEQHPIKLPDGFYIFRKLTVRECMRLQTVPEWYEFPVSDTQAYKMLGNGWTVKVIAHIVREVLRSEANEETQDELQTEIPFVEYEVQEAVEDEESGAVYVSNQRLNEVQRGLAEFACMVCHKKLYRDHPHSIDCAFRGIDNEFCPDIIESLREALAE